jgi:hypothetical protein
MIVHEGGLRHLEQMTMRRCINSPNERRCLLHDDRSKSSMRGAAVLPSLDFVQSVLKHDVCSFIKNGLHQEENT